MDKKQLMQINEFVLELNSGEALNMDDIGLIYSSLKEFNGEDDKHGN